MAFISLWFPRRRAGNVGFAESSGLGGRVEPKLACRMGGCGQGVALQPSGVTLPCWESVTKLFGCPLRHFLALPRASHQFPGKLISLAQEFHVPNQWVQSIAYCGGADFGLRAWNRCDRSPVAWRRDKILAWSVSLLQRLRFFHDSQGQEKNAHVL